MYRRQMCPASVAAGMAVLVLVMNLTACAAGTHHEASESSAQTHEAAAPESIDVRDLLSAREFSEAGLEALDDEELEALNQALARHLSDSAGDEAHAAWEASEEDPLATFGLENEHPRAAEISSFSARIKGRLDGWERGTRLELDNGQVWEVVADRSTRISPALDDAEVTIRRGFMGGFRLRVDAHNRSTQVRRVE